jgi:hypothetical protein
MARGYGPEKADPYDPTVEGGSTASSETYWLVLEYGEGASEEITGDADYTVLQGVEQRGRRSAGKWKVASPCARTYHRCFGDREDE